MLYDDTTTLCQSIAYMQWEGRYADVVCTVVCYIAVKPCHWWQIEWDEIRWMYGVKVIDKFICNQLRERSGMDDILRCYSEIVCDVIDILQRRTSMIRLRWRVKSGGMDGFAHLGTVPKDGDCCVGEKKAKVSSLVYCTIFGVSK